MGETETVAIVAVAAVGLFLIWEQMQQQAAVQNALLAKLATQQPAAAANPLGALAPLIGPVLSLL